MPEGWDPLRWTAYTALRNEDVTYTELARRVGRSRSTISTWIREFRLQWGQDVVTSSGTARNNLTEEARQRGQYLGGLARAQSAVERRQIEHDGYQSLAAQGADWIHRWMAAQEERDLRFTTVEDVLRMARVIEVLGRRMQALAPAAPHVPGLGQGPVEMDYPDLSELEAAAEGDHSDDMEAIELILAAYRVEVLGETDATPEPIEVTAREAS